MGNPVIATPNWSDSATLTASSAAGIAPVTNLQTMQPTDVWQSTTLTGVYIEADRGSAQAFNLVALLFTNATSAATWRVRAADSQANLTAAPDYDSGTITLHASATNETRPHGLLWIAAGVTRRWVRIDLTDAANPDGVLRAGRLYIGNAWQPTRNRQFGSSLGFNDYSERRRSSGGQVFVNEKTRTPTLSFRLAWLSEDEMLGNAYEIERTRGAARDVLIVVDPDAGTHRHKKMVYGLMDQGQRLSNSAFNLYEINYGIEGLL